MLPLIAGFLAAGPISGVLSDRYGPRPFAVSGPILAALSLALLSTLPVDFSYLGFGLLLFLFGVGNGLFAAPNRAAIMNSLPPWRRGIGSGVAATFQNSGQVLSIGIYFSLMIIGLSARLPAALYSGLVAHGVPSADAARVAHLSPVSTLFASLLGANPTRRAARTARAAFAEPCAGRHADQPGFLPARDHAGVRRSAERGLPLLLRRVRGCRRGVVAAWRYLPLER